MSRARRGGFKGQLAGQKSHTRLSAQGAIRVGRTLAARSQDFRVIQCFRGPTDFLRQGPASSGSQKIPAMLSPSRLRWAIKCSSCESTLS